MCSCVRPDHPRSAVLVPAHSFAAGPSSRGSRGRLYRGSAVDDAAGLIDDGARPNPETMAALLSLGQWYGHGLAPKVLAGPPKLMKLEKGRAAEAKSATGAQSRRTAKPKTAAVGHFGSQGGRPSTKYVGVSYREGKWEAHWEVRGEQQLLGRFATELEAANCFARTVRWKEPRGATPRLTPRRHASPPCFPAALPLPSSLVSPPP